MNFEYKKGPMRIIEFLGSNRSLGEKKADVIQSMELLLTQPRSFIRRIDKFSFEINIPNYLIDLDLDEEEIFSRIHKSTRADIRKAINREQFNFIKIVKPTDEQVKEFSLFYNSFAKEKNIALCNVNKLNSIRDQNGLIMTYVTDEQNRKLCGSMLLHDQANSQLYGLYGVTNRILQTSQKERNKISRANKLLQWKEIQLAKNLGLNWYNFGGEVDEQAQGVNDFKKRFGTVNGYDKRIYISNSYWGKIGTFFLYEKWKRNLKSYRLKKSYYDSKSQVLR